MRQLVHVALQAAKLWFRQDIRRLGAAVAFYAGLSLVPMLLTIAVIAGVIFSPQEVKSEIVEGIRNLVGQDASQAIREALDNLFGENGFSPAITIFNVVVMLVGATGMFRHLKNALNTIWDKQKPQQSTMQAQVKQEVKGFVRTTLVSLLMVGAVGLMLLLWLTGSTVLFYYVRSLDQALPDVNHLWLWQSVGYSFLFVLLSLTFALLYKTMPDPDLKWRDVTVGAVLTALLFLLGQNLMLFVIRQTSLETLYGTASLLTLILVWVYISAQMVIFGAVLTKVHAKLCEEQEQNQELCIPEAPVTTRRRPVDQR